MTETDSLGIFTPPATEKPSESKIPDQLLPYLPYIQESQANLQATLEEFNQIQMTERESLSVADVQQIGQYLMYLYKHPDPVAQEIHNTWVGDQQIGNLQERQFQFMAPYNDMDQSQELRKTRGDIKGIYRALQSQFPNDLPVFERHATDTPPMQDNLEGLDLAKVARNLMMIAHDNALIDTAAPFIHDTYLEAVAQAALTTIPESDALTREQKTKELDAIRMRPEGEAYQGITNKERSKRNVQLDIIAAAQHAKKISTQLPSQKAK